MKVSCLQENLNRGLGIVARAVATRATRPITNNVLLATEGSRLRLTTTNLEIGISCWIGAQVEKEGAITVPARLLSEFVNSLPKEKVNLSLSEKKILRLTCGRLKARMSGVDAEEFPPYPKMGDSLPVQIDAKALRRGLTYVNFAALADNIRPVLSGVNVRFEGDTLALAGTDGYRLAEYRLKLITPVAEPVVIIIPSRSLSELNRMLAEQEEPVEVILSQARRQVLFRLKDVEMVSQLLQGSFPNYPQLIPQNHATRTVVNVADFLHATKTASIFAREGSGIVRLQMASGKMAVSARGEGVGDNEEEIDAQIEGEEAKFALNSKYLMDVLSVLEEEKVALETTGPSSPAVLRPLGSENYVHVVMPMFVQW